MGFKFQVSKMSGTVSKTSPEEEKKNGVSVKVESRS